MASISREEMLKFARGGAVARIKELQAELETIYSTFPELRSTGHARKAGGAAKATAQSKARSGASDAWSAAARKAVSERMKRYWAARRAKAAKIGKGGKAAKPAK